MKLLGKELIYNLASDSVYKLYTKTTISVLAKFTDFHHVNEMALSARV